MDVNFTYYLISQSNNRIQPHELAQNNNQVHGLMRYINPNVDLQFCEMSYTESKPKTQRRLPWVLVNKKNELKNIMKICKQYD